jgi:hypothetical protein
MDPVYAATSVYEFTLWLHVIAAVVGMGATFAMAVLTPVAMGMDPVHLPYVHRVQVTINKYMASPGLLVLIATGIYMVVDGNWDFGSFWVSAAFLVVIVLGGMTGAYFIPADRRLEQMAAADIKASGGGPVKLSEQYLAKSKQAGIAGFGAGLLLVFAIYLMVMKPGA